MNAAKIIQEAINPTEQTLQKFVQDFFILYRPKDTVSGDFYWLKKIKGRKVLILADCTGHGVAGAFMTLIGNSILNKLSLKIDPENPADILEMLHQEIQQILKQEETGNNSGMDASVITWHTKDDISNMSFAGAKSNILYHCPKENILEEIKGTRKSIGGHQNEAIKFENHSLSLEKGSIIYLGSDGFEDQNNKKRKKFGRRRLKTLLSESVDLPLKAQKQIISEALNQHMEGTDQRDDILYLGLKI